MMMIPICGHINASPGGQKINQSVKSTAIYSKNESQIYYSIFDPEAGNWTAKIVADGIPASGEDYCLYTLQENSTEAGVEMLSTSENTSGCKSCSHEG